MFDAGDSLVAKYVSSSLNFFFANCFSILFSHCSSDIRLETPSEDNRQLKEDNRQLKEDNSQLKEDNRQLKEDVHNLQQAVENLSARMEELVQNVSRHMNNFNNREGSGRFNMGSGERRLVVSQEECCLVTLCRRFRGRKR